jgi:hypothetical protein
LEFLRELPVAAFPSSDPKDAVLQRFLRTAEAVAEYFILTTPPDGIPYWDTGAPGLAALGGGAETPADPFTAVEPVDSSAAVIAAQGFLRLGSYLEGLGRVDQGRRYVAVGLTIARTTFREPYLSSDPRHQGLILHSIYHRPNGWDYVPEVRSIPCGEATMWGDYHARELALMIRRIARGEVPLRFF